jgi:hypothetical protein
MSNRVWEFNGVRTQAATKSEARSIFNRLLGEEFPGGLPAGAEVREMIPPDEFQKVAESVGVPAHLVGNQDDKNVGIADTAPLAICRCALLWRNQPLPRDS